MAKYVCPCGEVVQTSGLIPNPVEWKLVSDELFDEYQGEVNAESLYLRATSLFRCPASGHLLVFWDGFDAPPVWYTPMPQD